MLPESRRWSADPENEGEYGGAAAPGASPTGDVEPTMAANPAGSVGPDPEPASPPAPDGPAEPALAVAGDRSDGRGTAAGDRKSVV